MFCWGAHRKAKGGEKVAGHTVPKLTGQTPRDRPGDGMRVSSKTKGGRKEKNQKAITGRRTGGSGGGGGWGGGGSGSMVEKGGGKNSFDQRGKTCRHVLEIEGLNVGNDDGIEGTFTKRGSKMKKSSWARGEGESFLTETHADRQP